MNKTFTSSKGVVLELLPVSQFKLDAFAASRVNPPIPTYDMKVVGGESITHPLDAEIAKSKGRLEEWEAYLQVKHLADTRYSKMFSELLIWDGIQIEVPDCESEWQKNCEHFGLIVPENPIERKLFYVYNELLGTGDEIGNLIADIMAVSSVDEEVVETMRATFRAAVQRKADKRVRKRAGKVEERQEV